MMVAGNFTALGAVLGLFPVPTDMRTPASVDPALDRADGVSLLGRLFLPVRPSSCPADMGDD